MFLSHCITGIVYIKTVVNTVKIGNTDTVAMTVSRKFYYAISPLCGVQRGEVFQASELPFVEKKKNTQMQVANCATPKLPASFPNS
jgi:hypothetical protein